MHSISMHRCLNCAEELPKSACKNSLYAETEIEGRESHPAGAGAGGGEA